MTDSRCSVPGFSALYLLAALLPAGALAQPAPAPAQRPAARATEARPQPRPQTRPHSTRVAVEPARIVVDDGDTVVIRWAAGDEESVRILGIDTPETRHLPHDLPYAQSFGPEARAFGQGVFAAATQVELLRAPMVDPFGRTLGYFFVNGRNYSVLVLRARYSAETVSFYGDNSLPGPAAEVLAAAKDTGPLPFEPPHVFRARMRELSRWMKANGVEAEQ